MIKTKYIVIPVAVATPDDEARALPPDSYFVIKSSDVFAGAALWGYAHTVLTCLEMAALGRGLSEDEFDRLQGMANELAMMADDWSDQQKHVPD